MFSTEEINQVEKEFSVVVEKLDNCKEQLFKLFETCSQEEAICLKFYYAFMPISDAATYTPELFLKIIRDAIAVKKVVPWGDKLKGELFFNYVLSYRINNEDIVDYREQFFNELYPRIKDKNMYDAVLEVNYWCFEKATYKSTDSRTASPLTVLRNAFGRCGEESTLCVAALRSVGIPARQCYTPRWAHCDDNHAWIEAWIDGKWHFTGACEPEAVMDKGWFVASAQRGMLIHSRVFSPIVTKDIITIKTPKITEINILDNYTKTKALTVKVIDEKKQTVSDVNVRFELVNFSQLYPIATLKTDENGECSLITGFGDLFIHINKDDKFLEQKVDMRINDSITFDFSKAVLKSEDFNFEMRPPLPQPLNEPLISEEQIKSHTTKVNQALEKRKAYESTFFNTERADKFAESYGEYSQDISKILVASNGNYKEIIKFIETEDSKADLKYKISLLKSLRDKDFSDITNKILNTHLTNALKYKDLYSEDIFSKYILCPRVKYETITDYREFISKYFSDEQMKQFKAQPIKIFDYIKESIKDCENTDYSTLSASPEGLLKLKLGSKISREILFVAICRTFGIPARLNPADWIPEYYRQEDWISVGSKQSKDEPTPKGTLVLKKKNDDTTFEYEKNFTVAVLNDGIYQTLALESQSFNSDKIEYNLPEGNYRIITSNRQTNGDILAKAYHTEVIQNKSVELIIDLRQNENQTNNTVSIEDIKLTTLEGSPKNMSELLSDGNNIVAWLEEGKEPTEHLFNEMLEKKETFRTLTNTILFIVKDKSAFENSTLKHTLIEMSNIITVVDSKDYDKNKIYDELKILDKKLPLVIVTNKKLETKFSSAGYNVGIADMLLKELN